MCKTFWKLVFENCYIYIRMFSSSFSLCWAALQWRLIVDGCNGMDGWNEDGWFIVDGCDEMDGCRMQC